MKVLPLAFQELLALFAQINASLSSFRFVLALSRFDLNPKKESPTNIYKL